MAEQDILIVGAGPAGALLAFLLARRGGRVTLLERQRDFEREFRGEVLQPSGLDVFHEVGLSDLLDAIPSTPIRRMEMWRGAKRLFAVNLTRVLGDDVPCSIAQPQLLEALVERARAFDGFRFEPGVSVRDLLTEQGRVVGVRTSDDRELRADLTIGCDGRHSTVRAKAGLEVESIQQAFDIVWCKVPPPPDVGKLEALVTWIGSGQFALAVPTSTHRAQIGWVIPKGAFGDLKRQGFDRWVAELSGHLSPEWGAWIRSADVTRPHLLSVQCDRLRAWTRPGLLLIGDAAHPMSPVGAQGLNIALRDAVVAANYLERAIASGPTAVELDRAAFQVLPDRIEEVRAIQDIQQRLPALLFQGGPGSRAVMDFTMPALAALGIAPWFVRRTFRQLAFGTSEVHYKP